MNAIVPTPNLKDNSQKILENIAEQLLPLFDPTDQKTGDFYWAFVAMQTDALVAALQRAADLGLVKLAPPA